MRIVRLIVITGLVLSTAACSGGLGNRFGFGKDKEFFDGQRYQGSAKSDRSDRHQFVASVRPVSASFDGAIEAARYEGVKHCIKYFGTSDIIWSVGPDTPRDALVIEKDTLSFAGTCEE